MFNIEQVLEVVNRTEEVSRFLRSDLQEYRILGQISELNRAQDFINSDYYWNRLNQLVQDYSDCKLKKT